MFNGFPALAAWDNPVWLSVAAGLMTAGFVLLISRLWPSDRHRLDPQLAFETAMKLDPFTHGSNREQRAWTRRGGMRVDVYVSEGAAGRSARDGVVLDRSPGGLRLNVDQPSPPGTLLNVRTKSHQNIAVPWVQAEVKSCRPGDDGWQIGCQFLKTPPSNVLMMFG